MKKVNILVLLDNPYSNDRRVMRESEALAKIENFSLKVLCTKKSNFSDYENINGVEVYRVFGAEVFDIKTNSHQKYAKKIIDEHDFDIVHAHDQVMLNLASKIKSITGKKIIYDSHELFRCWPLNSSAKGLIKLKSIVVRRYLIYRESRNIRKINGLITVNESIRKDLISYYNLSMPTISIRNTPEIPEENFKSRILKDEFNIGNDTKLLVYIGNNVYPRTINIEQVIDHFANKENTVFIIIAQFNWAKKEVEEYVKSINAKNVFFRDVVTPNDIPKYLSSADVGIVSSWNKKDLSYWYGLDNKLFEYMMSEIPILSTKQPEYIQIVEKYNLGECIDPDLENFYDAFERIIQKKDKYVENIKKAKKILNWSNESNKLVEFYKKILN